jgi:hypothetical protein
MINFIKNVFSEDGQGSYSRVFSGLITFSVLSWITFVVYKIHLIPDLSGATMFLASAVGVHYGVNKVNDMIKDSKVGKPDAPNTTLTPPTP